MISLPTVTPDEFEQYVRDCLTHLYDYPFLRDHPLVQIVVPDLNSASQVQVFRQILTEAIEQLRPSVGATFYSKQARPYNILTLRYIDQQQPQDVMHQLALSERQFYRDHPKAISLLSQTLWEKLTGQSMPVPRPTVSDISIESEIQRFNNRTELMRVDLKALLSGAISATHSLASQREVELTLDMSHELPIAGLPSSILRQTVLLLMSQLLIRVASGGELRLASDVAERHCRIVFTVEGGLDLAVLQEALTQTRSLQTLIETMGAALFTERLSDHEFCITLDVPLSHNTVLLVDDNPGMIDLFERYLAGQTGEPYHLLMATEGNAAVQLARAAHPNLIILDVMLPGKDGWEVLQNLKNHPTTQHIPVLICSVLDAYDLAISLGADAYLKKPPQQAEFLQALPRWLD